MSDLRARNPVLPGHHPDPSICRVGDDFYLVTSSFTYFPAIPVFRSRNLVDWEQIGNVIDRAGQLPLTGLETSDGVWAPTIRHHGGVFYVTCTIARDRRGWINFVATADDPSGPWSNIVVLDAEGIDPSLFFDDDGRAWYSAARDAKDQSVARAELWVREFDPSSLSLIGPEHVMWNGAMRGAWVEAPHIQKRDGKYWLIAAEGGTERNHAITAAVSSSVTGPYISDPRSPLLTHRFLDPDGPIQSVGHADLVDLADGRVFAVLLATRPIDGTHTLGRETFLTDVAWSDAGPVFSPATGTVEPVFNPPLAEDAPPVRRGAREDFRAGVPSGWVSLREPLAAGPATGPDGLTLVASSIPLGSTGTPALLLRPQQHVRFRAETEVHLVQTMRPGFAGLVVFQNQSRWAELRIVQSGSEVTAALASFDGDEHESGPVSLAPSPLAQLRVTGDRLSYDFAASTNGTSWTSIGSIPRAWFSTEAAGGFVGVHLGLHAGVRAAEASTTVRFGWFEYEGEADPID